MQKIRKIYPVDTAAKLFRLPRADEHIGIPAVGAPQRRVDPEALQSAAEKTLERYPIWR